jgi:hypothetical protein
MNRYGFFAIVSFASASAAGAAVQFERFSSLIDTISSISTLSNIDEYDHDRVLGPPPAMMFQSTSAQTAGARVDAETYLETNWWNRRHFQLIIEQGASLSVTSPDNLFEVSATCVAILQGRFTLTREHYAQIDLTNSQPFPVDGGPRAEFVFYGDDGDTVIADWRAYDPQILETGALLTPGVWDFQFAVELVVSDIYPDEFESNSWGRINLEIAFIPAPFTAVAFAPIGVFATRRRR